MPILSVCGEQSDEQTGRFEAERPPRRGLNASVCDPIFDVLITHLAPILRQER